MLSLDDRPPRDESRSSNVTLTTYHAAFSVGTVIVQRERNILLVYIKLIFIRERYAHSTLCVCARAFDRSRPHSLACYTRIYCACTHETSILNDSILGISVLECSSSVWPRGAAVPAGDIPRSVEVVVFRNLFVHVPEAGKTVRKSDKIARRNADFLSCTLLVY
jgi:hypothetical protein